MKNSKILYPNNYIRAKTGSELETPFPLILKNKNAHSPFLYRLNSVIQLNYGNELFNVASLSNIMCLCPMQFHRKVKKQTGLSPGKYLLFFRLWKAINLLLNTEDNIGKIAFLSGFSNQNNFSRAFKREFGYCPNHVRQIELKKVRKRLNKVILGLNP